MAERRSRRRAACLCVLPPARRQALPALFAMALVALAVTSRAEDLSVNAYNPFPIGSPRVMGMAGAFTGVAAGADAITANPAAILRPNGFHVGRFEIDYMLYIARQDDDFMSDFGNVGPDLLGSEAVGIAGFGIIGRLEREPAAPLGYGFYLTSQNYYFTDGDGETAEFDLLSPRIAFGRAFADEQLFVSLALDLSNPDFKYVDPDDGQVDVEYQSSGGVPLELGVLWVPEGKRFQIGARLKGRRESDATTTVPSITPFPESVVYPGEWAAGITFKLGERAPEDVGEWFDRGLVCVDLRGVFPVTGTTGFERFRSLVPRPIPDDSLVQPAVGVEMELYSRIAWLWLGTYREPARYDDVEARTHLTAGAMVRLFRKGSFSLYASFAADSADRYQVWTTSISTSAGRW